MFVKAISKLFLSASDQSTSMSSDPPTPIFPNEVVDMILDHLHDDNTSLKNCSLVSREWLATSRYHLFDSVTIHIPPEPFTALDDFLPVPLLVAMKSFMRTLRLQSRKGDYITPASLYFSTFKDILVTIPSIRTLILDTIQLSPSPSSTLSGYDFQSSRPIQTLVLRNVLMLDAHLPLLLMNFSKIDTLDITGVKHYNFTGLIPDISRYPRPQVGHFVASMHNMTSAIHLVKNLPTFAETVRSLELVFKTARHIPIDLLHLDDVFTIAPNLSHLTVDMTEARDLHHWPDSTSDWLHIAMSRNTTLQSLSIILSMDRSTPALCACERESCLPLLQRTTALNLLLVAPDSLEDVSFLLLEENGFADMPSVMDSPEWYKMEETLINLPKFRCLRVQVKRPRDSERDWVRDSRPCPMVQAVEDAFSAAFARLSARKLLRFG